MPQMAAYSAAKAGLHRYVQALRAEVYHEPITVTELAPGYIDTDMNRGAKSRPFVIPLERGGAMLARLIERRVRHALRTGVAVGAGRAAREARCRRGCWRRRPARNEDPHAMTQLPADTRPVAPQHAIDAERLGAWLTANVAPLDGPLEIAQFKGGQSNPTYLLAAGRQRYVLRRKPPGKLLPSAHAVDREYRVIRALARTGRAGGEGLRPVRGRRGDRHGVLRHGVRRGPRVLGPEPAGPGARSARRDPRRDQPRDRRAAQRRLCASVGLGDYGRSGEYIARQVARWSKQYQASETEKIEAMDNLIAWLPENIPVGDETSIVHGDYRIDNVIFHPDEPRILAVLDWELSTLGHPLADFAYHCMVWRIPPGTFRGLGGLDLAALGIPSEHEYVAAYCRRTGRAGIEPRDWEYYMVYNMFRIAAIVQGVMARALQGNASSAQALETGRAARPLAELAWRQVERLKLS